MLPGAAREMGWIGLRAQDPYGEALPTITEILRDRDSGAPEWLLLAEPGEREGLIVPLQGAVPTGHRIRVVAPAARIRSAGTLALGSDLEAERKRRLAEHYGLILDTRVSASGVLRAREPARAHACGEDGAGQRVLAEPARGQVVALLRQAHAMEQASLELLAAMRRRSREEELLHDLAFHQRATGEHARAVRGRLDELQAPRARPLAWIARFPARLAARRGRRRAVPESRDIAAALEFERGELFFYERLAARSGELGDERTAALARTIGADEEAMIYTLRGHRRQADPGARRRRESPLAPADELSGGTPGT